jgi:hypothetical protein
MLDVAVAYNRYKFMGNEFLTWLWYMMDTRPEALGGEFKDEIMPYMGNRIVLEAASGDIRETVTIKGDEADMQEGRVALKKGAMVTELNVIIESGGQRWQFTIKGESLNLSSLSTPEIGPTLSNEDREGALLEKAYFYEKFNVYFDALFEDFLGCRLGADWEPKWVVPMQQWIRS